MKLVITSTAEGAESVYAVDMDGDGNMDVLSASWDDNTIAWYEALVYTYHDDHTHDNDDDHTHDDDHSHDDIQFHHSSKIPMKPYPNLIQLSPNSLPQCNQFANQTERLSRIQVSPCVQP